MIFTVVLGATANAQQLALPKSTNAPGTTGITTPELTPSEKFAALEACGYDTYSWDLKVHSTGGYEIVPSPLSLSGLPEIRAKAAKGDIPAECVLGRKYGVGDGVPQDYVESVKWYRQAADQGDAQAQDALGALYDSGNGVAQDYVEAVKWYRKAANKGDPIAQYNLGACYYSGQGAPQDYAEGVDWFRKSAEQGFPRAQTSLGEAYGKGVGLATNFGEAVQWFRKAALQGNVEAQFNLGSSYFYGQGVPKDYAEAVEWFRKSAERGFGAAQYNLALCYDKGNGVSQNCAEAAIWYRKAAEQGMAIAQDSLGFDFESGNGVPQDYKEAAKWYRQAAQQGDAAGQAILGGFYALGHGVAEDYIEAYKWLNLAAAQDTNYVSMRDLIRVTMTIEQIAEGQRLAREFKPMKSAELDPFQPRPWTPDARSTATGTGFFITQDGFLVTAAHVVNGATEIRLLTQTGLLSARVVKLDVANDLALLKAEGHFSPLPIASSRAVKLGSIAATVGFPNTGMQGFAPKLAKGEIASLTGAQDDARYFQVSVPLQPGNSGGALVDERGNVVGVVSAKLDAATALATTGALPENVNYAVKSSFLLSFLESSLEVSAKLKEVNIKDRKFEDVVKSTEQAAVLVLVYR